MMRGGVRRSLLGFAACALLLCGAGQARANLIVNGGFETGDFTGWTLTGNPGFISIVSGGLQHSGNFAASFGAVGSPTNLSQTQNIATIAGHTYTLDFWLRNDGGPENHFTASFDGVTVVKLDNSSAFGYTEFTFSNLVATSNSTAVSFSFQQNPSFWRFDDVSVEDNTPPAVPEPASLALFGIGSAGIVGYGWRQRRRRVALASA
jgi:hypothetical protein